MTSVLHKDGDTYYWEPAMRPEDFHSDRGQGSNTVWAYFQASEDQGCRTTIYRRLYNPYDRSVDAIIKDNLKVLKQPNRWKVGSSPMHEERIGLVRFVKMPLAAFFKVWRQPIDTKNGKFTLIRDNEMRSFPTVKAHPQRILHYFPFSYGTDYKIDPFVIWPGIFDIRPAENRQSASFGRKISSVREDFRAWLKNGIKGRIYPFADRASTFELEEDEWVYLTDYGLDTT